MKLIDVTLPIRPEMPVWPGDHQPRIERTAQVSEGDDSTVSLVTLSSHTGTHIDAPSHVFERARSVDALPLEALYGDCYVAALDVSSHITAEDLESAHIPPETRRLLLHTPNSLLWTQTRPAFDTGFFGLTLDAAQWLVDRGTQLVGTDALSIEPFGSPGLPVHKVLLTAGMVVVEGLNLNDVQPGSYTIACLPLKLAGADGAPARVILIQR